MSQNKNQEIDSDGSIDTAEQLMNKFFDFHKNNMPNMDAVYYYDEDLILIDTEHNSRTYKIKEFAENNNIIVDHLFHFHSGDTLALKTEHKEDRDIENWFKSD